MDLFGFLEALGEWSLPPARLRKRAPTVYACETVPGHPSSYASGEAFFMAKRHRLGAQPLAVANPSPRFSPHPAGNRIPA